MRIIEKMVKILLCLLLSIFFSLGDKIFSFLIGIRAVGRGENSNRPTPGNFFSLAPRPVPRLKLKIFLCPTPRPAPD